MAATAAYQIWEGVFVRQRSVLLLGHVELKTGRLHTLRELRQAAEEDSLVLQRSTSLVSVNIARLLMMTVRFYFYFFSTFNQFVSRTMAMYHVRVTHKTVMLAIYVNQTIAARCIVG